MALGVCVCVCVSSVPRFPGRGGFPFYPLIELPVREVSLKAVGSPSILPPLHIPRYIDFICVCVSVYACMGRCGAIEGWGPFLGRGPSRTAQGLSCCLSVRPSVRPQRDHASRLMRWIDTIIEQTNNHLLYYIIRFEKILSY